MSVETKFQNSMSDEQLESFISSVSERTRQGDAVDKNVRAVAHATRVVSRLLRAVSGAADTPERMSELMQAAMNKVNFDADYALQKMGVPPTDAPDYLAAMVRGAVMDIVAGAIENNNGSVLEPGCFTHIEPLTEYISALQGMQNEAVNGGEKARSELHLIRSMASAVSAVMLSYASFNYFHDDSKAVADLVRQHLQDRVIDGTLGTLKKEHNLSDGEASWLGNTLLANAGDLLAQAWNNNVPDTMTLVSEMSPEERIAMTSNGLPLDEVFREFDNLYSGVDVAVRANALALLGQEAQKKTFSSSQSMSM